VRLRQGSSTRTQGPGLKGRWQRLSNLVQPRNPKSRLRSSNSALVDGEFLRKLDRLSLAIGRDLVSGLMGEHLAVRRTSGIEFADYRQYSAGDDLRRVDWNAYARLGTLHVRQAQAEHDTLLYLLVDGSPSMDFGEPSKFLAARRLAAALGYVALAHLDSVVLSTPGADDASAIRNTQHVLHTIRGRAEAPNLFRYLQDLNVGQPAPFDEMLVGWSTGQGAGNTGRIAVIISDLLLDEYRAGVRQLAASGFQVTLLHLLSPEELQPPDDGELELWDSETGQRMDVHLGDAGLAEYHRRLNIWLEETETWSRSVGAGYLLVQSDWDIERVLLETLRRRGVTV